MKAISVIASAAMVAGGTMAAAAPIIAASAQAPVTAVEAPATIDEVSASANNGSSFVRIANAHGVFAFVQDKLSSNEAIANVFTEAARLLCGSPADDLIGTEPLPIAVSAGDQQFVASTQDMEGDAPDTRILACSCAANLPGGGAIVNARVSGVSIEAIAATAGVR